MAYLYLNRHAFCLLYNSVDTFLIDVRDRQIEAGKLCRKSRHLFWCCAHGVGCGSTASNSAWKSKASNLHNGKLLAFVGYCRVAITSSYQPQSLRLLSEQCRFARSIFGNIQSYPIGRVRRATLVGGAYKPRFCRVHRHFSVLSSVFSLCNDLVGKAGGQFVVLLKVIESLVVLLQCLAVVVHIL